MIQGVRVRDILVEVAAGLIVAAIITLVGQVFGLFGRISRLESKVDRMLDFMKRTDGEFHRSHAIYEDGEVHHKRGNHV